MWVVTFGGVAGGIQKLIRIVTFLSAAVRTPQSDEIAHVDEKFERILWVQSEMQEKSLQWLAADFVRILSEILMLAFIAKKKFSELEFAV